MDFFTNFGQIFFTHFLPVDPFENELYEKNILVIFVKKCIFGPTVMP